MSFTWYDVWIVGRKEETKKRVKVPNYSDGGKPTPIRVKDTACRSRYFDFGDYVNLRVRRVRE